LSKDKIIEESLKPSTNWVEAGSGDMGKLYYEVLGWYVAGSGSRRVML